MRRHPIKRLFLSVLTMFAIVAFPASADIGYYAKWGGTAPITVGVSGISTFPVPDQAMIRAAMADWSASPSVEYVEGGHGIRIEICDGCGFLFRPNDSNGRLHGGTIQIDRQWLGNSWMQGVYCHELGHGLGLGETSDDPGSCMAAPTDPDNQHPSQMDFDELAVMYPLGLSRGH